MTTQFANAVTWQELQPGGICRLSVDPRRQAEKERGHHEAGDCACTRSRSATMAIASVTSDPIAATSRITASRERPICLHS
ncbi:hypothetical protein [Nostocoides australiense]|nr:hypothetical protein [Actinomycetota bacterium]